MALLLNINTVVVVNSGSTASHSPSNVGTVADNFWAQMKFVCAWVRLPGDWAVVSVHIDAKSYADNTTTATANELKSN